MNERLLQHLILSAITSSMAAGCVGRTTPSTPTVDGGTAIVDGGDGGLVAPVTLGRPFDCSDRAVALEAFRAAGRFDYVELRRGSDLPGADGGVTPPTIEVAVGKKCATASAPSACDAAVSAASTTIYLFGECGGCLPGGNYLVSTKGDKVETMSSMAALLAATAPIDAPAKAWMVATAQGYAPDCDAPWIGEDADGFVVRATQMMADCPIQYDEVLLRIRRDGTTTVLERRSLPATNACVGRRPAGLARRSGSAAKSLVGGHFARIAHLEAASVSAFRILHDELAAHRAPRRLLRAAERAASDEIRHARAMTAIAKTYGAPVPRPRVTRPPVRSLFEIARENAVEGCVRETYGAAEGLFQSRAAGDPRIRRAMRRIAGDEVRHGALAWEIAKWADSKLSAEERARVRDARDAEVGALRRSARKTPHPDLVAIAGVPAAPQAQAIVTAMEAALWA